MHLISCTYKRHATAILDIINHAIIHTTAIYDYKLRSFSSMTEWFESKREGAFPIIGVEDKSGTLVGFASYGTFRAWPAFKYSAEHSIYIHPDHRGKGLGSTLIEALIEKARTQNYHLLIGGIDTDNKESIKLHIKHGFKHAGTIMEAGFKFGRWLDLAFYQLTLDTPVKPADG
ncbi:MAG: N-acetyltransferase [Gammaproteobacteria bacterium]|nr:N-acetyltransferase [Gammaproteobacteria bacterium]